MLRRMMRIFTIVLMFALLGVWLYLLRKHVKVAEPETTEYAPTSQHPTSRILLQDEATPVETTEVPEPEKSEPTQPDDLKRIEGIGPKIASLLQDAGIATFAQLAATDVARLREILDAVNLRIANPTTWPEQATLAAAGNWEGLESLQSELKGGRRV